MRNFRYPCSRISSFAKFPYEKNITFREEITIVRDKDAELMRVKEIENRQF